MGFFGTFVILYIFWIVLSGRFDYFHLSLGIISCAIVAYASHDLLFKGTKARDVYAQLIRFVKYLPWHIYQIILAGIYITYLALHPRMSALIDPHIIRFKTRLKKDLSLMTFGNSITLTPGTITVLIKEGYFYVHAINEKVAEDLLTGEMEDRVGGRLRWKGSFS
jgi:multicomponent Na+:H+ antiporter subunit E